MLKFSEIFEFSTENSYFERIRMVRMVRMVRSLADRTFQLWEQPLHPPILQRVVGQDSDATPGPDEARGCEEDGLELRHLLVHLDAERLEHASCTPSDLLGLPAPRGRQHQS